MIGNTFTPEEIAARVEAGWHYYEVSRDGSVILRAYVPYRYSEDRLRHMERCGMPVSYHIDPFECGFSEVELEGPESETTNAGDWIRWLDDIKPPKLYD